MPINIGNRSLAKEQGQHNGPNIVSQQIILKQMDIHMQNINLDTDLTQSTKKLTQNGPQS